jgi:hypothetical protein
MAQRQQNVAIVGGGLAVRYLFRTPGTLKHSKLMRDGALLGNDSGSCSG